MINNLRYEEVNAWHVDAAVDLVISLYEEERTVVPFLPDGQVFQNSIRENISTLFEKGTGLAALCGDELMGFIAGFKPRELFGKCGGIYVPLYGHGARKEAGRRIYQKLYQRAAEIWVQDLRFTHAITMFAHDNEVVDTWFWQGFGMRCVDAIREASTSVINMKDSDIIVNKADMSDIPKLADIHRQHNEYYRKSPVFMPNPEEDPVKDLTEWMSQENHHLWIAYQDERPLGYMRIQPDAETFVSEHRYVMNITGAYVADSERNSGVGSLLLARIQEWLLENGYSLCGVDFEGINTTGSNFWRRYFTPYTYSLVRRIDERVKE